MCVCVCECVRETNPRKCITLPRREEERERGYKLSKKMSGTISEVLQDTYIYTSWGMHRLI